MGNCINHEATIHWGGDDWGSLASGEQFSCDNCHNTTRNKSIRKMEEETLLGDDEEEEYKSSNSTKKGLGNTTNQEVKIKITKKQLEELLGKVEVQGMSVQQVLTQLMNVSDQYDADQYDAHQRAWRPNLQSIPEV